MNIPWRYLPPNIATFASVCVSVAAIRSMQVGDDEGAAWLVLLSMLLDKVDGSLARALRAQSRFGVEMDSFADFLAFGLTPGLLLMCGQTDVLGFGDAPALLYIGCCLARLVRFNVVDADDTEGFRGLPSTASGGLMASGWLVAKAHGFPDPSQLMSVVAVGLGLFMVSSLRMPKPGKAGNKLMNLVTLGFILAAAVCIVLRVLPELVLALGSSLVIAGLLVGLTRGRKAVQV